MQHYMENSKYQNYKFFAYVCGFISLMSFWIMLMIGSLFQTNGQNSFLEPLFFSPILAIVAIITSLIFASKAREIRQEWEESQEPKKS